MLYLFSFVLGIFNCIFRGLLIKTFWSWFILSLFPNLPTLNIVSALGLSMFMGAISPWPWVKKDKEDPGEAYFFNAIVQSIVIVIAFLTGLVVHWFM